MAAGSLGTARYVALVYSSVMPSTEETGRERPADYRCGTLFAAGAVCGIGADGQRRLSAGHVAVVGVGATGAATAGLLARAGVGRLTLIDRDFVEPSNLQRQVLFDEADALAALPKAEAARRHIAAFNEAWRCRPMWPIWFRRMCANLLGAADIVLDCTDNFETRYLINDFCVEQGKPWIYAAAVGAYAATMNILPRGGAGAATACLACVFPAPPSGGGGNLRYGGDSVDGGKFCGVTADHRGTEVFDGQAGAMRRTLLSYDLWSGERSEICGGRTGYRVRSLWRAEIPLPGRRRAAAHHAVWTESVQIHEHARPVDLAALAARLRPLGQVRANGLLLRFERAPHTLTVFPDGRALVQGTTDVALARSLYARFIGS